MEFTKDKTEETEIASEIPTTSGIPKKVDLNGNTSYNETLDFYIGESMSPGLSSRIPPFYSRQRDKTLRKITSSCDEFLIAIYNVITKVAALVPTVEAINRDNEEEVFAAKVSNELLRRSWIKEILMALFDLMTQDNGMHLELLDGTNNPRKPLQPYEVSPGISIPCIGLKHWDSQRVRRTGNSEFPIVIIGLNEKEYPVHHTRIISWTDMPSPKARHYGVGLCAASRIIVNMLQMIESEEIVSDMLFDGLVGEIIFGQPFTSQQLEQAFRKAEERSQSPGEPRYRRFIYVGIQNQVPGSKFQIQKEPLRRLPEDYKKVDWVTLFMYLMAAALGIDAREVFPATVSGATRADAEVQHRKSQNKFTRLFIQTMVLELEAKFAPMGTKVKFDFTDVTEELEKAEARKALAEAHQLELLNGTVTREVAARQLHQAGYLNEDDLEEVLAWEPIWDRFGNTVLPGQREIATDNNTDQQGNNPRTTTTSNNTRIDARTIGVTR